MSEEKKTNKETLVFRIANFLGIILLIALLNLLPFPSDYGFWSLTGIFFLSIFGSGILFQIAAVLAKFIYKAIIEILVVTLLFLNATFIVFFWALFDNVSYFISDLGISTENEIKVVLIFAVALFIFNIIAVVLLFPFARIANIDLLGE